MSKVREVDCAERRVIFKCPGCDSHHQLRIRPAPSPSWEYNENPDAPTFKPSILAWHEWPAEDGNPAEKHVCHSFVTDGKIAFCGDSTHKFAGQTLEIPDWPHPPGTFGGIKEVTA